MRNAARGTVSLCAFIWWNEETKSNRETPVLSPRSLNLVHAGNGQLAELAVLIELLVVHRDPHAPGLFRDDHQRPRIWRCRVLNQSSRVVLVESRVHFLGQDRDYAMGPGRDRAQPSGTEISKGIK